MTDPATKARRSHPLRSKPILCWAMYDWANSAYTTLVITVLVAYIQRVVFPTEEWGTTGAVVWAWGISLSMLLGAILSPIVGAIADTHGSKRTWLAITALSGSAASILLGIVPPEMYVIVVILFVFANLMLELSLGFYNGFLPEIVDEEQINSVSAWGYGLGYLGGGIALAIAMVILALGDQIGLETMTSRLQWSLILMGIWWGLFSLPAILVLRDQDPKVGTRPTLHQALRSGGANAFRTLRSLQHTDRSRFFCSASCFTTTEFRRSSANHPRLPYKSLNSRKPN